MPDRTCSVDGCSNKRVARGYCHTHWDHWRKTADPAEAKTVNQKPKPVRTCSLEGCDRKHEAKGLCQTHYVLMKRNGVPERRPAPPTVCSIEGCEKRRRGRGYCDMHLWRLRKYGDPNHTELIYGDSPRRFMAKVDQNGANGCWLWEGGLFINTGYGRFSYGPTEHIMAHRYSYELHVGPIPEGLQLDHLCFVPRCVNPAHLEPVTGVENRRRRRPWTKKKKVT